MSAHITFDALMAPRLCDLRPCIDKSPKKIRMCMTCGLLAKPYKCRVDALRPASSPEVTRQGEKP